MTISVNDAILVFTDPSAYADVPRFEAACAVLRKESPIHYYEDPTGLFNPFYAITKHADVLEIELHNEIFINEPRPVLGLAEGDRHNEENGHMLRTLIHVDDPEHRDLRGVTSEWFLPKNLAKMDARLAELSKRFVDKMASAGGSIDFATDIAMQLPLHVILDILGLPESDYPRMLKLTQELFGAADEEMSRGTSPEDLIAVITDFFAYFTQVTEDRRANPTADLASAVANGTIRGEELSMIQTISYYVIAATAGHDTTASAIAGGLQALIENPDQLDLLRNDPSLYATAADEIIRWVTPVKHFMRTATEDYTIRGVTIKKGQSVLLSYPSANRDEEVFDHPQRFDITRSPNKQLSFGFGVHYCLGAMLARMEIKAFFGELVPRLNSISLNGEPSLMKTTFVGGLKHLPIAYSLN
ncbi:MAG: cytochrome P450 [Ilumatobacteraceae bacterium]|jgi:cytochrome P450|nr:cytochrome P450 [Actinomycetota bacterium]